MKICAFNNPFGNYFKVTFCLSVSLKVLYNLILLCVRHEEAFLFKIDNILWPPWKHDIELLQLLKLI